MKILRIAAVDLRRMTRFRSTFFFTIALPVVLILLIGLATQRFAQSEVPVGLVAPEGGLAEELTTLIADDPTVALERFDDVQAVRKAVRRGVVLGGIVVPRDYDRALRRGEGAEVNFVVDRARGFPAPVRSAVAAAVAEQGRTVQAARFATERTGGSFVRNLALAREIAGESEDVVRVRTQTAGPREATSISFGTGFAYQAPANLVLFVFITSVAAAGQVIETRRLGITRRMLGTPTRARTILGGAALGRFAIALAQALLVLVAGTILFGVDWGDPLGAALLIGVFVLVGTGAGMLFGTLFRTPEQAGSVGPTLGIGLGMLGGCMWPLEIVPEPMQAFGHLFPHAWAMDAWIDLTAFGRGVDGILTELAVLAGFAAATLALATWRLRRILTD